MDEGTRARVAQMAEVLSIGGLGEASLATAAEAAARPTARVVELAGGLPFDTDPPAFAAMLRSGSRGDG